MPFQPPEKINPPPTQDQLWDSTAIRIPEQKLWLAVLMSALEDADFEWLESYTFELWCESVGWRRRGSGEKILSQWERWLTS